MPSLTVSACVCTFRRPTLLPRCLESLICQNTGRHFEIVVVDNDAVGPAAQRATPFVLTPRVAASR